MHKPEIDLIDKTEQHSIIHVVKRNNNFYCAMDKDENNICFYNHVVIDDEEGDNKGLYRYCSEYEQTLLPVSLKSFADDASYDKTNCNKECPYYITFRNKDPYCILGVVHNIKILFPKIEYNERILECYANYWVKNIKCCKQCVKEVKKQYDV